MALAVELQLTNQIIKKTGLFDKADRLYGEPGAKYQPMPQGGEGGMGGLGGGGGMGGEAYGEEGSAHGRRGECQPDGGEGHRGFRRSSFLRQNSARNRLQDSNSGRN